MDGQLSLAHQAFNRGAYDVARTLLFQRSDAAALRLLLDVALRTRDWNAIETTATELARCGGELAKLGRLTRVYAQKAMRKNVAMVEAERSNDPIVEADLLRLQALIAWMDKDLRCARALLDTAKPVTATQKVQHLELRAWAHGWNEYRLPLLLRALDLAVAEAVDVGLIAHLAHPVAVALRETNLSELETRALELLEQIEWHELRNDDRFYCERALAWKVAESGNAIDSLYRLGTIAAYATSPLQRAILATDRARVDVLCRDEDHAAIAATEALERFNTIGWETDVHNDAILTAFASTDVLSRLAPTQTRELVERVRSASTSPALGAQHSPLREAYSELALAFTLEAASDAIEHGRKAYRAFESLGYRFRAAVAALRVYDLSPRSPRYEHWLAKAQRYVDAYPRGPLARELRERSQPLRSLTPRRRQILAAIDAGRTNEQIAKTLGISENTVKEHVRELHQLFGVERRTELAQRWREVA